MRQAIYTCFGISPVVVLGSSFSYHIAFLRMAMTYNTIAGKTKTTDSKRLHDILNKTYKIDSERGERSKRDKRVNRQ